MFASPICTSRAKLNSYISTLPTPIVFTNGVFDLLHVGHIHYLEQSRNLGQSLIVAINSDSSAQRLHKGVNRPFNNFSHRACLLSALRVVDLVIRMEDDTPRELINLIRPNVYTKGSDYCISDLAYSDLLADINCCVKFIDFKYESSTSKLARRIYESYN